MNNDIKQWFKSKGAVFLKDIGLRSGLLVLDFGCGHGHYTIPAAKVVGKSGLVYALDKNKSVFNQLTNKAATMGLNNIIAVQSLNELKLFRNTDFLDIVLLYDVLHSDYFTSAERNNLLESLNALMKVNSLLSIYPKHMGPIEIKVTRDKLQRLGFYLERKDAVHLIHDGIYDTGYIFNFRKQ